MNLNLNVKKFGKVSKIKIVKFIDNSFTQLWMNVLEFCKFGDIFELEF